MFQLLRLAEYFIVHGVPLGQLLQIMGYMLITSTPLGLPVAFLVGLLVSFNRISTDSEIIAIKAAGYSLMRMAAPLCGLAVCVSLFSLVLNLSWVPTAEKSLRRIMVRVGNTHFSQAIREGAFSSGLGGGLLVYTEKSNNQNGRMEKVFIYDERNKDQPMTVVGKSGETIRVLDSSGEASGMVMQLQDGSIHQTAAENNDYTRTNFDIYQIWIDMEDSVGSFGIKPKMYSLGELLRMLREENGKTPRWFELDTELWRRVSVALVPLLFVFLGMGLGTTRSRDARFGVLAVSFVVLAAYWQLQVTGIFLGSSGRWLPAVSLEIPNILTLIGGVYFFRRAAW